MEHESAEIDVDYLVIGAGAVGMAFVDVILTETSATVALVDRYSRPGGHKTCWHVRTLCSVMRSPSKIGTGGRRLKPSAVQSTCTTSGDVGMLPPSSSIASVPMERTRPIRTTPVIARTPVVA